MYFFIELDALYEQLLTYRRMIKIRSVADFVIYLTVPDVTTH